MAGKGRTQKVSSIEIPEYLRDPEPTTKRCLDIPCPPGTDDVNLEGYVLPALEMRYQSSDPEFLLRQGYEGDAGFDLAASEDFTVDAHDSGLIPCGVKLEIPEGLFVWIVARSSTMTRWGFMVLPGIIDTGFRGELFASVYNTRGYSVSVKKGDRIAQIVPLPNVASHMLTVRVNEIAAETSRGAAGFGSTGR